MELRPGDAQQQLIDAFAALYAKESTPERVRDAEPLGFDERLWSRLVEMGAVSMAVPEEAGGWGASLLDLALVAEQHGRALGSAPVIETQVAARLLARVAGMGSAASAAAALDAALSGEGLLTIALAPSRDGRAVLVPAGAVATDLVVMVGDDLVLASAGDDRVVPTNSGSMPLADLAITNEEVLASGAEAHAAFEAAVDDWLVLTASALVGIAARSLEIGVEYAAEREAFGQRIGSFQGIAHRLADSATAVDASRLLARKAAWAHQAEPAAFAALAAESFALAAETARDASYRSLHFHGGYGFMVEYDIQLHYRRARAWASVGMSPTAAYRRAADARRAARDADAAGRAAPEGRPVDDGIDFALGDEAESLRREVRAFLAEHVTRELHQRIHETGTNHDPAFTKALVERGWVAPSIPAELGGGGLPPMSVVALAQELRRVDAPTYGTGTTTMVAAVIGEIGTPHQRDEIIPKALAGEIVIVLGFTEPECGSDLASVTTKAVRDGDDWVIDGQKMFTTNAHIGDYAFLLARTNPDVPKHQGLTMFLVPLDQPGVEIQAVRTLSGERTNITYLNGVRVSDRWRIGEVDGGWATMGVSLRLEHGTGFAPAVERLLLATEAWATEAGRLDDHDVRLVIGRTAACFEAARALQARVPWMVQAGIPTTVEGPMSKLFSSESLERRAEEVVEVVGPDALRSYFDPTAPVDGLLEQLLFFSLGTTIYAGTSEVHRNMIAQRGLGLPRPT